MELTAKNFDSIINNSSPCLVDFWADWCGPCQLQSNILEAFEQRHPGKFKIAKLNVDDEPSIARRYSIQTIPTLIVFNEGNVAAKAVGVQTVRQLEILLGQA